MVTTNSFKQSPLSRIRKWLKELPERPRPKFYPKFEKLRAKTRNFRARGYGRRTRKIEVDGGYVVLPAKREPIYRYESLGARRTTRQCAYCGNQATARRFSLDKDNEVVDKSSRVFVCGEHRGQVTGDRLQEEVAA